MRAFLLLVVFLALQFVPDVGLATTPQPQSPCGPISVTAHPAGCTPQDAYEAAVAFVNWYKANGYPNAYVKNHSTSSWYMYEAFGDASHYTTSFNNGVSCPSPQVYNTTSHVCFDSGTCLAKPPLALGGTFNLSVSTSRCDSGCSFQYQGTVQQLTTGAGVVTKYGTGGKWAPTGNACAVGDPVAAPEDKAPPDQQCTPSGDGQTVCLKKDGRLCYPATTGRQICWRPGETGEKPDGATLQKRAAGESVGTPVTPPPEGATFDPANSPLKMLSDLSTVAAGGTTSNGSVTTTTQNFVTTQGVNAGGSAKDQGENADGSSGSSSGNAGGEGDADGDPTGAGAAGAGVNGSDLYVKDTKTIADAVAQFKTAVLASPLIHSADAFFGGCEGMTGACPVASWESAEFRVSFDLAKLCTDPLDTLLGWAGWVMLAAAGMYGFKVALL